MTISSANIDDTKPVFVRPMTQSTRDNFTEIKTQLDNAATDIDNIADTNVETYGAAGDGVTDDATAIQAAIDASNGNIIFKADSEYIIGSTLTLSGASADRFKVLRSDSDYRRFKLTAKSGFTGVMIQNNGGDVIGCAITGSDDTVTGHKGIQLGDATYWNPSVRLENIRFYGGLYDGVYTNYEHDNASFKKIHCFVEMGRSVMYMDATASHAPSGSAVYEEIFFTNPVSHAPVAGDQIKIGLFESRADGLQVSGIINNYDRCLDLGLNEKVYNSTLSNLHCEERRTIMDIDGVGMPWAATTAYSLTNYASPTIANANGHFYIATTAGTAGGTEPTWPTSGTVVDGTVTWTEVGESIGIRAHKCDQLDITGVWLDQHLACISMTNPIKLNLSTFKIGTGWGCSLYANISSASPAGIRVSNGSLDGTLNINEGTTDVPYFGEFVEITNNANTIIPDHTDGRFSIYESAFPVPSPLLETASSITTDFNVNEVISVDATSSNRTITVAGSSRLYGRRLTVVKNDSSGNTVTVSLSGKTFIGGGTSQVLSNQGDLIEILYLAAPIKLNVIP